MRRILWLLAFTACTFPNPGTGEKVGTIVKVSNEGLFCKTNEAQLIRGGMANGSGAFGVEPFNFTIPDHLLAATTDAFQHQREVRISYVSRIMSVCSSETGHVLTAITPVQ